jgi:endonuclease/exonuclease/phosphatase family metal-dependent hydrolase
MDTKRRDLMNTHNLSRRVDFDMILDFLLPVIVITLGLQMLRIFIPGVAWYLRDTVGVATLQLLPYAFGAFLLGFFAAGLRRILGSRLALWATAGGLAVVRLSLQINASPPVDFWLSVVGTGMFLNFLPLFISQTRAQTGHGAPRWTYGFVLGLAFDITLRGLFNAVDLSTFSSLGPGLVMALIALITFWALWREPIVDLEHAGENKWKRVLPLTALGPYLALQMLFFGSQGFIEEVSGLNPPFGFVIVMLGYLAACAGLAWGFARPYALSPGLALIIATALALAGFGMDRSGSFLVVTVLLGQFFMGWGLAVVASIGADRQQPGLWRTTASVAGGMLLFLILIFAYYVAQDIALPFPRSVFPAAAGALLGLSFLLASVQARSQVEVRHTNLSGLVAAVVLALVPLVHWTVLGPGPNAVQPEGGRVLVMSYNIHSGFNSAGLQDLEAIARVIEDSDADIVALQEVSRVRFMDGSADIPAWLSRRLDMPYLFRGTEEPIWGNAILSRYPVVETGSGLLPRAGTLIERGYLWARIDAGGPEPLLVIATHLHHLGPDSRERQAQVPVLIRFWDGQRYSIVLGDMNAEPGSPEMEILGGAGLLDVWAGAGVGPGHTFSATDPVRRIDWIWHTADLSPTRVEVIHTPTSDHLPVLATFEFVP